jgi:hypothetical protein
MALGIVLAPYGHIPGGWPTGITQTRANRHNQLTPFDPQYNTRGEAGLYYDTPLGVPKLSWFQKMRLKRQLRGLGAMPTDAEIATSYGYTPTYSGWVATAQGYYTPDWIPPDGVRWQGIYSPPTSLSGLREGDVVASAPATADDVVRALQAHNDRVFALTIVSTVAVATSAMITIFRTLKLIREDKKS